MEVFLYFSLLSNLGCCRFNDLNSELGIFLVFSFLLGSNLGEHDENFGLFVAMRDVFLLLKKTHQKSSV